MPDETTKGTDEGGIELTTTIGADEVASLDQQAAWASKNWGMVLITGILALIFGVIVLSNVVAGLSTLVWLTGFYLLYAGVVDIATSGHWGSRALGIVMGVIAIIGAVIVLTHPGIALTTIPLVMGVVFVVWGIARVAAALSGKTPTKAWPIFLGIVMVIAGIVAIANPWEAAVVIVWVMGFNALFYGVFAIVSSFTMRGAKERWASEKAALDG